MSDASKFQETRAPPYWTLPLANSSRPSAHSDKRCIDWRLLASLLVRAKSTIRQ
jgi:hypothetical protein